ncbi:hypothetical protein LCGC14_1676610 [marine sediment metagenome]|uniref:Uncharacterized protein n=1 Tax=marine sediment metagenome TaxID=412755 RepID=A0A0F9HPX2_9ZZZZ
MLRKIVINTCFGGFGLSDSATELLATAKSCRADEIDHAMSCAVFDSESDLLIYRDDLDLIKIVESLGNAADGFCSQLSVIEIPSDIKWEIEEYDGNEWISERHQTWS